MRYLLALSLISLAACKSKAYNMAEINCGRFFQQMVDNKILPAQAPPEDKFVTMCTERLEPYYARCWEMSGGDMSKMDKCYRANVYEHAEQVVMGIAHGTISD